MDINFSSIEKALASLEDALSQKMDEYRRDGAIQRFEYTFELSWKFMQKVLKVEGVYASSPMQVFREAKNADLIEDFDHWVSLLKQRNLTVHTYNESTAQEVFNSAKEFPPMVHKLIKNLKARVQS